MVFVYISQAQVRWKVQNNTSHGLKIDRRVKVLLVMLGIECLCFSVFLSAVMTLLEDVKDLCTDITATLFNNKSL